MSVQQSIDAAQRMRARARLRWLAGGLVALLLLAVVLPPLLFGAAASFQVTPTQAAQQVQARVIDGAGFVRGGTAYFLGAQTRIELTAPGFAVQTATLHSNAPPLSIALRVAKVHVRIDTEPSLAQTEWRVDGALVDTAAQFTHALSPGAVQLEINHPHYQPHTVALTITVGESIARQIALTAHTAELQIASEPSGAQVWLDGAVRGQTPLAIDAVRGGEHRLRIALDGYRAIDEQLRVDNRSATVERNYRLINHLAALRVTASPPDGALYVDGVRYEIDAALSLAVGSAHLLRYEKSGYGAQVQTITLPARDAPPVSFALTPSFGEVIVRAMPRAEVRINGVSRGTTPQTFNLRTVAQTFVLLRDGYRTERAIVTPDAARVNLIDKTLQSQLARAPALLTFAGIAMKLFDPRTMKNRFTMGSPKSDEFHRANEFLRAVQLTRPFYASVAEISESQFAAHQSGRARSNLPVRNVTWQDAAKFCNWLSARAKLTPVYRFQNGVVRGADANADGYRLLTEAEWEWLARLAGRRVPMRFVWGNARVIPAQSGNFADESAKRVVPKYIPGYNDGYATVAPIASFPPDVIGLYDIAGNVSEWVHEIYDLRPPSPQLASQTTLDPFGSAVGAEHLIKGASFRSATTTRLRSVFRDGASDARDDVGFRIGRYVVGGAGVGE